MDAAAALGSSKRKDVEDVVAEDPSGSQKRLKRQLTQESDLKVNQICRDSEETYFAVSNVWYNFMVPYFVSSGKASVQLGLGFRGTQHPGFLPCFSQQFFSLVHHFYRILVQRDGRVPRVHRRINLVQLQQLTHH